MDFGEHDFTRYQLLSYGYPVDFGEHANNRIKYLPNSSLTNVHGDKPTEIRQCPQRDEQDATWAPSTS